MTFLKSIAGLAMLIGLVACDDLGAVDAIPADATASVSSSTISSGVLNSGNRKFIQAMDICLNSFPSMLNVRRELRSSNFTSEGRFSGEEYFSAFNRSIIAFASTGQHEPICGFGRNGLRDDEAVLVVNATLAAKYGENLLVGDVSDDPHTLAAWLVTTDNDTEVVVAVRRQIVLSGLYRGSLVYVAEYRPEQ